jgi:TonB family protein
MPAFKDHFSRQALAYSRYRPAYPPELIAYVASLTPSRGLAVDCATGSGQAAVALAVQLPRVIAVDGSVRDARVLRSVTLLDHAALDAVKQWRYAPTRPNGVAVPVIVTVTVHFRLQR